MVVVVIALVVVVVVVRVVAVILKVYKSAAPEALSRTLYDIFVS